MLMINKNIKIELFYPWGGVEKDLTYYGETMEEITENIDRDNNELLYYLRTGDDRGKKAFCFSGLIFKKEGIYAAKMSESLFD